MNHTTFAIEQTLLSGALYEQATAEPNTALPVSVRLGKHISAVADKKVRTYPGHEVTTVDPDGVPVSEIVVDAFEEVIDRAGAWLTANPGLEGLNLTTATAADVFDNLPPPSRPG
ncbi:hypothetical protein HII36_21800 [Nonomuraea sp. NN258]|uniref:hypothetical protein n=1 Tax=Nonomuraea antri TaxID=2730852 RepID=UPI0015684A0D|nr:hypothetical protein [Nonomuraea antri]NRQ34468.1 hypothetical protein [Nonomuraea antri]